MLRGRAGGPDRGAPRQRTGTAADGDDRCAQAACNLDADSKAVSINAIHALLATMTPNVSLP